MFHRDILPSVWHIHSTRLGLCWDSTGTQQWLYSPVGEKRRMSPILDRHGISHFIYPMVQPLVTERAIINSHISSLINKNMKTVAPAVDGSDMYQQASCDESPGAPGPVKGETAAVGLQSWRFPGRQWFVTAPHMKAPLAVACLTLSKMTAGFQQAGVICHKTNWYKSARQI